MAVALILFMVNYMITVRRGMKRLRMTIPINEVEKNGKTGDIILFKPNYSHDISDFMLFKVIPVNISGDMWTHVGMLYRDPDRKNELFVWESTDIKGNDKFTKKSKSGVKMVPFSKRVKNFDGVVGHCEIKKVIDPKEMIKKIKPCSRFPYSNIESLMGKPNIRRGISACQFAQRIMKGVGVNGRRSFVSHPGMLVGEDHHDPRMIV